jgi:hypothetical protein
MSARLITVLVGIAILAAGIVGLARITGDNSGKAHPLGTEVVVGMVDVGSDGRADARAQVGLTVLSVRQGTQEELSASGLEVEPEDRSAMPYYVAARFANRGPNALQQFSGIGLEDSDGNLIGRTLIFDFGDFRFEPCPEEDEGTLAAGERLETCSLFLVPDGVDVAKVSFLSDRGPRKEPEWVYWATH